MDTVVLVRFELKHLLNLFVRSLSPLLLDHGSGEVGFQLAYFPFDHLELRCSFSLFFID